jgi:hypothetical protein
MTGIERIYVTLFLQFNRSLSIRVAPIVTHAVNPLTWKGRLTGIERNFVTSVRLLVLTTIVRSQIQNTSDNFP